MASKWDFKKFFNAVAYWALVFAAIALIVGQVLHEHFTRIREILIAVSSFMAFLVASVNAFHYAKSKRNIAWFIIFIFAALVVNAMLLLALIK